MGGLEVVHVSRHNAAYYYILRDENMPSHDTVTVMASCLPITRLGNKSDCHRTTELSEVVLFSRKPTTHVSKTLQRLVPFDIIRHHMTFQILFKD